MAKSCGGELRKLAMGCASLWIYRSQSPYSCVSGSVVMYAIVRSYMLVYGPNMCIVGLVVIMSLYGLRYVGARVRVWAMLSS